MEMEKSYQLLNLSLGDFVTIILKQENIPMIRKILSEIRNIRDVRCDAGKKTIGHRQLLTNIS